MGSCICIAIGCGSGCGATAGLLFVRVMRGRRKGGRQGRRRRWYKVSSSIRCCRRYRIRYCVKVIVLLCWRGQRRRGRWWLRLLLWWRINRFIVIFYFRRYLAGFTRFLNCYCLTLRTGHSFGLACFYYPVFIPISVNGSSVFVLTRRYLAEQRYAWRWTCRRWYMKRQLKKGPR